MNALISILQTILPAGIIFFIVYYMLQKFFDREAQKEELEIKKSNFSTITPLKIQAYERIILLLERIDPENLVMRSNPATLTAKMMQEQLLNSVRSEFEHNLTQQLHVSNEAWEGVVQAKEEVLQLINMSASKVDVVTASGIDLATVIIQISANIEVSPTKKALIYLKDEFRTGVNV